MAFPYENLSGKCLAMSMPTNYSLQNNELMIGLRLTAPKKRRFILFN
jgi:hypothetical protein